MAQFKKHLFGSSYFGLSTAFEGAYTTPPVDANEPFDGTVDFQVWIDLPVSTYLGSDSDWFDSPKDSWVTTNGGIRQSNTKDTQTSYYISADQINVVFDTSIDTSSSVNVVITDVQAGEEVFNEIVNLDDTHKSVQFTGEYRQYLVSVINADGSLIKIKNINGRTGGFKIETLTSVDGLTYGNPLPVTLTYDETTQSWKGSSEAVTQQQFVKSNIVLATSDANSSPSLTRMITSSGDMSEHTADGWWAIAVDLTEAAKDKGVTFKQAKHLLWTEKENETTEATIRSTTTKNTFPSKAQVRESNYWLPETAPYKTNRKDSEDKYGVPWSRIKLKEESNLASLIGFEMSPKTFSLNNVKNLKWQAWRDQSFYPLLETGVNITYEFYVNKTDYENGIPPIYTISNAPHFTNKILNFADSYLNHPFYIRIQLQRNSGMQTPVVDFLDLKALMKYTSPANINNQTASLSALDDFTGNVKQIAVTSDQYNWPSNQQELPENAQFLLNSMRKLTISYTPRFPGQVELYFKNKEAETQQRNIWMFNSVDPLTIDVWSKVVADEPKASTEQVDPKRLVYHYSYNGGTIQYPNVVKQQLMTDFSPNLHNSHTYQFQVTNGWPNEKQKVPYAMTWEELAELFGQEVEALKALNPNVKLYQNKIPQGLEIILKNETENKNVKVCFESTQTRLTKKSIWNNTANDNVQIEIPTSGEFSYTEWVSEEKTFTGYLNANDMRSPYIRERKVQTNNEDELQHLIIAGETYESLSADYGINQIDLERANNNKELVPGDILIIPAGLSLPVINPEAIFDNLNPYTVEIIPYSTQKKDGKYLQDDTVILGSDDEPPLNYTYKTSDETSITLKRGSVANGRDSLPFANVSKVIQLIDENGIVYQPYSKNSSGTETGDYELKDNYIDWHPRHSLAKEPESDVKYTLIMTYDTVDTIRIVMTTDFMEKSGYDKLWRSQEIKQIKGIVTPEKDVYLVLPKKETFSDYHTGLTNVDYVVEDDDLWVNVSVINQDGVDYIKATMNGESPKRNWYPEIQTGFYYLKDQEYYLYSEPLVSHYGEKTGPIIENVIQSDDGITLHGEITNMFLNSTLENMTEEYVSIIG